VNDQSDIDIGHAWTVTEQEQLETGETAIAGVIFDDAGEALPADPIYLARRLGQVGGDVDVIAYAVQTLGFVHVAPIHDALLVRFEPSTICHLAAFAAFYEIAGHAQSASSSALQARPAPPIDTKSSIASWKG
jgi:hypothetical protein